MARPKAPVGVRPQPHPDDDRRGRLEALRDRLEAAIAEACHRDLAPLAARYQSVLADLSALPAVKDSDGVDDLGARRDRRRAAASGS